MIINYSGKTLDVTLSDSSVRIRSIMGEHTLTLHYALAQHVEIPLGAWCEFEGLRYELKKPEHFKKKGKRNFEYTLELETNDANLYRYRMRNIVDGRLKFSLTATPREHLQLIVDNMNKRESGWTIGDCIVATEKVISYNFTRCNEALQQLATEYETEYEIIGKTINLCKVEYEKDNPLELSAGRGNGLLPGSGRVNSSESKQLEILLVQGGSQNIDFSKYGSQELLLPKNQTYTYNGCSYRTSEDGTAVFRDDKPLLTKVEDGLDLTHIYPKRVGVISQVLTTEQGFCDIIDSSIPDNLNYETCLIAGETMTIIFQTGMLAGKEFDVKYKHSERRFEIVEQEIDGMAMPKGLYMPKVGDKYAVFKVMLPDAYICDNATQTGASWDMLKESVKYLYENEGAKFTYTAELDGMYAKDKWLEIGGKIRPGGYVSLRDDDFLPTPELVRIISVRDYPTRPHKPKIELSNGVVGGTVNSELDKIENAEVEVDRKNEETIKYTKRRYRDAVEALVMVEGLVKELEEKFTGGIMPITVKTMAILLGDPSLQYIAPNLDVVYNGQTKVLQMGSSLISHQTLGKPKVLKAGTTKGGKAWISSVYTSPPLTDPVKTYYLYLRASKTNLSAVGFLSETPKSFASDTDYPDDYNLLVGILSSEYEGERSFAKMYGYMEILPGRITADNMIIQADKTTFADSNGNEIAVFDGTGGGIVRMKNISINGFFKQNFHTLRYGSNNNLVNIDYSYNIVFEPESNTVLAPALVLPYDDKYNGVVFKFVVLQGGRPSNAVMLCTAQVNGEYNSQKLYYTQPIFASDTSTVAGIKNVMGFNGGSGPIYIELLQVTKDIIMVLNAGYALNEVKGIKSN